MTKIDTRVRRALLFVCAAAIVAAILYAALRGRSEMLASSEIVGTQPGRSASPTVERRLIEDSERSVTFALRTAAGEVPQFVLFDEPDQAATAASINYWRDTPAPPSGGVVVAFKGLRFLRHEERSDSIMVRLIGLKNEIEMSEAISLTAVESGQRLQLHFGPVTLGYGPITGTSEADLDLQFDPQTRRLNLFNVSGYILWKRVFTNPQSDKGTLHDIVGYAADIPTGGLILKPE